MNKRLQRFALVLALCFSVAFAGTPFFSAVVSNSAVLVSARDTTTPTPLAVSGYNASNPNGTVTYLQFFNSATAGAVTVGVTTPYFVLAIPSNGVIDGLQVAGANFSAGIVIAATTTATGSTAPTNAIPVTIFTQP